MNHYWGKLVRDEVPTILFSKGIKFELETLTDLQYEHQLARKLVEEAEEVVDCSSRENLIEELGDLQEVIDHIMLNNKITTYEVMSARIEKNQLYGDFSQKQFIRMANEEPKSE